MKKLILILSILSIALYTTAQTFVSNNMSKYSAQFELIDFYDEAGKSVVSVAPKFYRQHDLKERIKPIKIGDQSYFIKLGRNGVQSVYNNKGKHVGNLERNGEKIQIIHDGISTYYLQPKIGFVHPNILKCKDSEGNLISEISLNKDRKLEYKNFEEKESSLLLMSLCIHKYQELLLGDRGRLVGAYE